MDYRLLGRSGLRVSKLGLGTMTFGTDWGWGADEATCREIYDAYRGAGGNMIDTANMYTNGSSERITGDLIASDRDDMVLATKFTDVMGHGDTGPGITGVAPNGAGNGRKNMVQSVEGSLKRMRTDRIDLLWVHSWDFATPMEELMRGLDDLVASGKVLYVGLSDAPAWAGAACNVMADLRGWTRFIGLQIEYSLIERTPERELVPMADAMGMGVVAWSPLASGVLTGKYNQGDGSGRLGGAEIERWKFDVAQAAIDVAERHGASPAQVALAWLVAKGAVPLVAGTKVAQVEDNLRAADLTLSADDIEALDGAQDVSLGFPHDFLEATREITWGNAFARTEKAGVTGLLPRHLKGGGGKAPL